MKYEEFFKSLTEYYGGYGNDFIESMVVKYVKKKFDESELPDALARVFKDHSNQYKQPPDIAIFERLFEVNENIEAVAIEWWNEVTRSGNIYLDVFCEDIRVQSCLEAMGGWSGFCGRDPKYEALNKKEFVRLFKMYHDNPSQREPRVLRGISEKAKTLFIGDSNKCLQIMENTKSGRNEKALQVENHAAQIGHIGE